MAIRTLYLPSVPLYLTLHPLCLCHQTQGISYTTPTLCMTSQTIHVISYSVGLLSEQLFRTLHTSMYNFTPSTFMKSYPICTLSPYRFHKNTTTIPGILTPYLTSQPLYLCHHTDGNTSVSTYRSIDDIKTSVYVITLGTRMTSYTIYLPSHSHYMT